MRETRSSGSVRGASGDGRPYRERLSAARREDTNVSFIIPFRPLPDANQRSQEGGVQSFPSCLARDANAMKADVHKSAARGEGSSHPSHPALRRPSTMWAWSSGRIHGTRCRTYMSNEEGVMAMAFSNASFASSISPS
jgi:hypothetical protein